MALSERDKTYFDTFGYLHLPGLFAEDIADISSRFDALFETHKKDVVDWVHEVHDNKERRFITDVTEKDDYFGGLLQDPRIRGVAAGLLGEDYDFIGSDASIYNCGTNFHQDGAGIVNPDAVYVKMALYLDPADEETGAIRVIPGTQHRGDKFTQLVNRNIWLHKHHLDLATDEVPAKVLPSMPGDLLLWDYRILHATRYGGNQRRMLALEFCRD